MHDQRGQEKNQVEDPEASSEWDAIQTAAQATESRNHEEQSGHVEKPPVDNRKNYFES